MKKTAASLILVLAGCALLMASAAAQEDMMFVDRIYFDDPQRPSSVFRHDEHNLAADIWDCNVCHHVYDAEGNLIEDESSEDMLCIDCHTLDGQGSQPGLRKAFHLSCKGCHIKESKGPVMCGECHLWRQPAAAASE